jgi:hypothetical protein
MIILNKPILHTTKNEQKHRRWDRFSAQHNERPSLHPNLVFDSGAGQLVYAMPFR